jgi:hypothetical protein
VRLQGLSSSGLLRINLIIIIIIFFFFLVGLVFELRALHLAKQALYLLSHASSSFCSGYFGDGGLANYVPGLAFNCNPPDLSFPSI